jgi:hypothetical protein
MVDSSSNIVLLFLVETGGEFPYCTFIEKKKNFLYKEFTKKIAMKPYPPQD